MESRELTREDILKADDLKIERVDVPEWGGHVFVRVLPAAQYDKFQADNLKVSGVGRNKKTEANFANFSSRLAVLAVVDSKGKPLFDSAADVAALAEKSGVAMERVIKRAMTINGFDREAVEEATKNS